MPHIVNGCGTWYYGKKNLRQYEGVCGSCHKSVTLSSYDTRLYFVVFLIPIIPLHRKRIIEDCPSCRRHRAMSLDDWQKIQVRLAAARGEYNQTPTDPRRAEELLRQLAAQRDLDQFIASAGDIETHLGADAETLVLLAVVNQSFGRQDERRPLLEKALALEPAKLEIKEALAECLLDFKLPDEAAPLLKHVIDTGASDQVNLLYHMAQILQGQGRNDEALVYFDHCEAIQPRLAGDSVFVKLRDASRENQGSTRKVEAHKVASRVKSAKSLKRAARFAAVGIPLVLVGYAAVAWLEGRGRKVFIVNGLASAYTARIDKEEFRMAPGAVLNTRLSEGAHHVQMADATTSTTAPAEDFVMSTPFLTRPFKRPAFVINPDRTALIVRTKVFYGHTGREAAEPQSAYFSGKPYYALDGIDHPFEDPPHTITTSSTTTDISRQILQCVTEREAPTELIVGLIHQEKQPPSEFREMAKWRVNYYPYRREPYMLLGVTIPDFAERVEILKPLVALRPVSLNAHRFYQDAMERLGRDADLEREYASLTAADPNDKTLLYLRGRCATDWDRRMEMITAASTGDRSEPTAGYYLAHLDLATAKFDEAAKLALPLIDKAEFAKDASELTLDAYLGAGRFDEALALVAKKAAALSFQSRIEAYCVANRPELAKNEVEELLSRVRKEQPDFKIDRDAGRFLFHVECDTGDYAAALKHALSSQDHMHEIFIKAYQGDLAQAEALCNREFGDAVQIRLMLHLAAALRGNSEIASRQLGKVISLLEKEGSADERAVGAALRAGSAANAQAIVRPAYYSLSAKMMYLTALGLQDSAKMYLTALGLQDSANRKFYYDLARRLNFGREFPYPIIRDLVGPADSR